MGRKQRYNIFSGRQWILYWLFILTPLAAISQDLSLKRVQIIEANLQKDDLSNNVLSETDTQGNIYIAGEFRGTTNFDLQGGNTSRTSTGEKDLFAAKYSPDGELVYVVQISSEDNKQVSDLAINPVTQELYVAGQFSKGATFGEDLVINDNVNESTDGFLIKISDEGNVSLVERVGGLNYQSVSAVDIDASGRIYIAGAFALELRFKNGSASEDIGLSNKGDVYMARYSATGNQELAFVAVQGSGDENVQSILAVE